MVSIFFAYHSPTTWNSLPLALRYQQESDCFKRALKTHLYSSISICQLLILHWLLIIYHIYLTVDINVITLFQSLFRKWFVGHIGVCLAELSRNLLPYIFYHMFILFFYVLGLF